MKKITSPKLFFLIIAFICLSNYVAFSQDTQVVLANEKLTIHSKVLNEDREILIRVPENYARAGGRFPVVYMLDGHVPRINLMTGTIQNLVASDQAPEMILVSIANTDRGRDMTPTVMANPRGSGGADNFLRFIETELIPAIDQKYRTEPYRIIVGHSLSGLFITYAFLSRPHVFHAYLAASPHLQWDDHFILKRGPELMQAHKDSPRMLFVGLGDEPNYLQGFNGLMELLKKSQVKKLEYEFSQMLSENHTSINAPVFHLGLRKAWKDLQLSPAVMDGGIPLAEIEKHYKAARDRYGYEIPMPETVLNTAGYRLLQKDRTKEALEVFEENTKLYPASANTYDSYAEALVKDGQLRKAKENLEKAVQLAEKGDNPRLTEAFKENLKKVAASLGQ